MSQAFARSARTALTARAVQDLGTAWLPPAHPQSQLLTASTDVPGRRPKGLVFTKALFTGKQFNLLRRHFSLFREEVSPLSIYQQSPDKGLGFVSKEASKPQHPHSLFPARNAFWESWDFPAPPTLLSGFACTGESPHPILH